VTSEAGSQAAAPGWPKPGRRPDPSVPGRIRAVVMLLLALAAAAFGAMHLSTYQVRVIDIVLIYMLLGMGLNMVIGYAGLLDLGFVAFYAIGAYSYAILASGQFDIHVPFAIVLFIGGGLAGLAGVLLGIPVLRLRGDYLAIVTLGFGEIIRLFLNNLDGLTNGPQGISRIDEPYIFGIGLNTPQDFFWLLVPLVAIAFTLVWRLENSILGLAWAAIREDQDAARGIGINTTTTKLLAFGLSAVLGGVAGVIFAGFQRFVDPVSFTFWESLTVVLIVVIGGLGNLIGVLVGATALIVVPELLRDYAEYRMFLYGIALVVIILVRPRGLIDRRYNPAWLMRKLGWR
jgi:branched-chain amino acid transport system permease protein